MLHLESDSVRAALWSARFGLEREALRVTRDGRMSRTPHPFPQDDPRIVRDFCENQTEINTGVSESAAAAVAELERIDARLRAALAALPEPETLWLGSNPPPLGREEDIPAARFTGARAGKTAYREYAAARYGRRKMCFCGVHVNLSFGPDLLAADFAAAGGAGDPRRHADALYCELAAKAADRIWLLVALMAASPLADPSLFGLGGPAGGAPLFCGFASLRCSELGFWNDFVPVFDYSDAPSYARSVARYVEAGLIAAPTELYYPVRVKPRGVVTRESTDTFAVNDPDLQPAMDYIARNLSRPFGAAQIASALGMPRIRLDRLFAARLGRSAGTEIARRRLARAQKLLAGTDMSLAEIAARCGYCHASFFIRTFRRATGLTPAAWRRQCVIDEG